MLAALEATVLETVTVTELVAVLPAASLATADIVWVPFDRPDVANVVVYGEVVIALP